MKLEDKIKDLLFKSLCLDETKDLEYIGVRKFGPKMFFILLKNGKEYIACIPFKSNQIRFYTLKYFQEIVDDFCTGSLVTGPVTLEYNSNKDETKVTVKYAYEKFFDGKVFDIDSELVIMKIQGFNFNWCQGEWDGWIFYIWLK